MHRAALATSLVLLFLPGTAIAQDVVGRSIVDGQAIELLSDQTWRYTGEAPATDDECDLIADGVSFCAAGIGWMRQTGLDDDTVLYRFDDRNYAVLIVEAVGSDDGMTQAFMRDAVIENAAAASGMDKEDIPVLDVMPAQVDEREAETIIYGVELEGLDIVYANTVLLEGTRTLQLLTYAVGSEFTPQHQGLNETFLGAITIE